MKKVYQYYQEPQGDTGLRMQLRVPQKRMPIIRALDKIGRVQQKGYKYSRNQAVIDAIAFYTEHHG